MFLWSVPAKARISTSNPVGHGRAEQKTASLFRNSDGERGRGAAMKYLAHIPPEMPDHLQVTGPPPE
jgi:hypothetical protein